jgi:hypothetical protein
MTPKKPTAEAKPRTRGTTPFDEAKRAQTQLEAIEMKRRAVIDSLSDEAAAMLEALEELRAKQTISEVPSTPETE